jgi:hypothetical protein
MGFLSCRSTSNCCVPRCCCRQCSPWWSEHTGNYATFFFLSKVLYTILCACNSLSQAGNVHGPLALCVPVMSHAGFVGFVQIIYQIYKPNGSMQLYEFIIIFGILMLLLSQLPSFHSLRHINLASLVSCLGFSLCVFGGSIYVGRYRQDLVNVLLSI